MQVQYSTTTAVQLTYYRFTAQTNKSFFLSNRYATWDNHLHLRHTLSRLQQSSSFINYGGLIFICEIKIERVAHYLNVQRIVSTNIEGNNRNTISSSFSSRQVIKAPTKVEWDPALMWFSQISYITYTEWKPHTYRNCTYLTCRYETKLAYI